MKAYIYTHTYYNIEADDVEGLVGCVSHHLMFAQSRVLPLLEADLATMKSTMAKGKVLLAAAATELYPVVPKVCK